MMLYADDALIFAKSPEVLQSMLNGIETYCVTWGLKINTTKAKAMIFEKGRNTTFYLNHTKLEIVSSLNF